MHRAKRDESTDRSVDRIFSSVGGITPFFPLNPLYTPDKHRYNNKPFRVIAMFNPSAVQHIHMYFNVEKFHHCWSCEKIMLQQPFSCPEDGRWTDLAMRVNAVGVTGRTWNVSMICR